MHSHLLFPSSVFMRLSTLKAKDQRRESKAFSEWGGGPCEPDSPSFLHLFHLIWQLCLAILHMKICEFLSL